MQKNSSTYKIHQEQDIQNIKELPQKGETWFFYGDLGYGKTTLIRHLIRTLQANPWLQVRSPTYTYYSQYGSIYHFDLYRVEDYDGFISIGGEEVLEGRDSISLIEWPEILEGHIQPTHTVHISLSADGSRTIEIRQETNEKGA